MTRGPANPISAPGSARDTSPIDAKLAAWAREGTASLFDLVRDDPRYTFLCNIDSMAHVQKGTIGLFLAPGRRRDGPTRGRGEQNAEP